jgi:glycosyltransferase involved in cell wall biosynthesis
MPPLVSIIIPAFNYGRFITTAVESALSQTYLPVEVIVVDDGSTDNTRELLARYGNRLKYIYQDNKGLSAARNTGIRAAKGEWIALLDADDVWHQQKLKVQLKSIAGWQDIGLIGSSCVAELPKELEPNPKVEELSVRDFVLSSRFGPSGALIRRSCFEKVGLFDESLRAVEDRDMWLRLAVAYPCVRVLSPCWWYRQHQGQMNRHADRMFTNYKRVLDKFFAEHPEHKALSRLAYSYMNSDAAWSYFEEGRRLVAHEKLAKSIYLHPASWRDNNCISAFRRLKLAVRFTFGPLPNV